jgi:hypothetical protein
MNHTLNECTGGEKMRRVLLVALVLASHLAFGENTVLKLYRPFGEAQEQAIPKPVRSLSGQCLGQSLLNVREDAWRCQAEGKIFDPCFLKAVGPKTQVLCPKSPWAVESVAISVPSALNGAEHTSLDMSVALPWAVELVNGARCQAIESNEVFDGMPVHYRCSDNTILLGHLQRCKATWTMLEKTPKGVETAIFKRAWF